MNAASLTMVEFERPDFAIAKEIASALGYAQQAYTSTSALIGLFCLRDNAEHRSGCVIKTKELGFLFVQDVEDLNLHGLHDRLVRARIRRARKAKKATS